MTMMMPSSALGRVMNDMAPPQHEIHRKSPRGYCAPLARAVAPSSRCYDHLIGFSVVAPDRDGAITLEQQLSLGNNDTSALAGQELVYIRLETTGKSVRELSTSAINERLAHGLFEMLLDDEEMGAKQPLAGALGREIRAQILSHESTSGADKCRSSMERFLCRLAYPSCHFRRWDASALVRPPCREDCLLLRDVLCPNLNWSKFAIVLVAALNSTLKSSINALDLEAQGEHLTGSSQPPSSASFAAAAMATATAHHQDAPTLLKTTAAVSRQDSAARSSHYNYSFPPEAASSIHFYWPHSRSIQRCEWLPFRSIEAANLIRSSDNAHHQQSHLTNANASDPVNRFARARRARRRQQRNLKGLQDRWPMCSSIGLSRAVATELKPKVKTNKDSGDCSSNADGSDYLGSMNRTSSGLACQLWQSQEPHQHTSSELLFDNMRHAHNYCRNPGGMESRPWCYTQDKGVRWEYCDIVKC